MPVPIHFNVAVFGKDPATGDWVSPGASVRAATTLTIPSGGSVSPAIDLTSTCILGFIAPAAWDAAAITLEVSSNGSSWATALVDSTGAPSGTWAAGTAGAAYSVDLWALLPFKFVRIRSGSTAVPVNQTAARAFTVLTRPLA